jgi:hypothetical protein
MFSTVLGVSASAPVNPPKADLNWGRRPVATLEHRELVHPVTRADCLDCLPAPCCCGQLLCPSAVEHRLEVVSSESYWRTVA